MDPGSAERRDDVGEAADGLGAGGVAQRADRRRDAGLGQLGEVLGEDYLRTARGKGVRESVVLRRHALPPASAPVIALVGVNINLMITNVALMESVFNIPGSFRYIERALVNRDVDLVQGMVLEATFFIVCANFLADAIQAYMDPRVRQAV